MRVLITGGAGFIGARLSKKIAASGGRVVVLDALSEQVHDHQDFSMFGGCESIECIRGDVRDYSLMSKVLEQVDAVVHLAAETGTGQSMYEITKYSEVNIQGTANLMQCISEMPEAGRVKRVVVASSRAIFGEGAYTCPDHGLVFPDYRKDCDLSRGQFDPICPVCSEVAKVAPSAEDTKINPSSLYGVTKQVQEQMVMMLAASSGVEAVSLRYQNVYGPGQALRNPYTGILSIFSSLILSGGEINIFEDGLESRDFVYIDDVVDATYLSLVKAEASGNVFNIGTGVSTSVLDIVRLLERCYEREASHRVTANYRLGDIRHNVADISKAQDLLGYKPKVSIEEGVHQFTRWVLEQESLGQDYSQSLDEMRSRGLLK